MISAFMFFNYGAFPRYPYFHLRSYQLSTSVSLFFHISMHYLGHFIILALICFLITKAFTRHSYFLLGSYPLLTLVSLIHFRLFSTSQPWAIWPMASAQSIMISSLSSASSLHLSPWVWKSCYIFLQIPTHLTVTLPFNMPPAQFTWHFHCLLFKLRHRCISCPDINTTLCGLSKSNI